MKTLFRILIIPCALSAPATPALANYVGNDTQNFNPITSGIDYVTVHSSETLAPGWLNVGAYLSGASNVLPSTVDSSGTVTSPTSFLTNSDLNFGYGLSRGLEIGLGFASLVRQSSSRDEPGAQFSNPGLNEIRALVKYRVFPRSPLGVALILSSNLNQVKNNPFLGEDPGPTWNFEVAADTEAGANKFAANLGYRSRQPGTRLDYSPYEPLTSTIIGSLGYSRYFPSLSLKVIGEVYASHMPKRSESLHETRTATEALLGFKHDRESGLSIHGGLGREFNQGLFTPDIRLYAGLTYSASLIELSPPPLRAPSPTEDAAPVIQRTTVIEGFLPEDIRRLAEQPFDEIIKTHEFALRRTLPAEPEKEKKPPFEVVRLDDMHFEFGSSVIHPKDEPKLKSLIRYLNAEPEVLKLRVEGHTDSVGSDERNRLRSESRAAAIRDFMKSRGLRPEIGTEVIGYGPMKPIADNGNAQGRAQNRRVEVRLLRVAQSPADRVHDRPASGASERGVPAP